MQALGKVDIVVNNAGISHAKAFDTVTDEDWQGDLDLKLFAAIRLFRARAAGHERAQVGPHRQRAQHRRQGAARQLDADQRQPRRRPRPHQGDVQENAPHNVLVNAMLVGLIESDQWQRRHKRRRRRQDLRGVPAGMAKGRIPLGRMGKAEEFARMACFLCSDAGSFITGVAINVDGGASPVV